MKTVWSALFCFVLVGVPAHAKIYKWVDENGNTHFTKCESIAEYRLL